MNAPAAAALQALADEALAIGDTASAAIFRSDGDRALRLVAAAGISGPALDGLVAAVQHPAHPVARARTDPGPTFDVRPINPGGPALRSHLPLRASSSARPEALGVLAVAHDRATDAAARRLLADLADRAGTLLASAEAG